MFLHDMLMQAINTVKLTSVISMTSFWTEEISVLYIKNDIVKIGMKNISLNFKGFTLWSKKNFRFTKVTSISAQSMLDRVSWYISNIVVVHGLSISVLSSVTEGFIFHWGKQSGSLRWMRSIQIERERFCKSEFSPTFLSPVFLYFGTSGANNNLELSLWPLKLHSQYFLLFLAMQKQTKKCNFKLVYVRCRRRV